MPRMRSTVDHQATAAIAKSNATRPSRVRTAANDGARPAPDAERSVAEAITAQAAQENGAESPDLPSYLIPNALMFDRFASAAVSSEPTG
jgi:hypothetical protein